MEISIEDLVIVYVSPFFEGDEKISYWESKIRDKFGPLSGYIIDLDNNVSIDDILFEILFTKPKGADSYPNYFGIKDIYLEHIKSLQKDLKENNDTIKQEIETLESKYPSGFTVDILKKYGILEGIEFLIPREKASINYEDFIGENVYKGGKSPYQDYWEEIISSEKYIKDLHFNTNLTIQVLIYSKTKRKFLDITNFLSSVTTNNFIGSGGNFDLQMNLVSQKDIDNETNFQDNNISISGYNKALYIQSVFRENDLVFIRFENLKIEKLIEERIEKEKGIGIKYEGPKDIKNNKNIRGKYWDIIGLIDNTSINSTYNEMGINIAGRDLIKLFIEDYNFFIPLQFANNPEIMFGGGGTKVFNRLFMSGEYVTPMFIRSFKSIENSVGFIISQLTNTQILDSECLKFLEEEYGEDLSKQFRYTNNGVDKKNKKIEGVWGLVNYSVDKKINHLRLADAALRSPEGSVLQQIHKICQEPFVEIIADTFVDKYNIYLRRPPFSIKDISEQKFIFVGKKNTISDSLSFNQEVYTVYQLSPQGGCFISNDSFPLAYLPMIVLDEYVKMWGIKMYSQTYSYININDYVRISSENSKKSVQKENFVEALLWLIETNAYLPFSRRGTITIIGDRRIKVGQWIYYEKSNEVFYVEGVQHSANINGKDIDRKTILTVSRGLVKDYISASYVESDVNLDNQTIIKESNYTINKFNDISYKDLVDIKYLREGLKELFVKFNKNFNLKRIQFDDKNNPIKSDSIVNTEVFNFFCSGAQFEGKEKIYNIMYETLAAVSLEDLNKLSFDKV